MPAGGYGSLRSQGRRKWRAGTLNQQIAEVAPFEIIALNELDFPISFPPLQLFLTCDGFVWPIVGFDINEPVNSISFDE